jgi:ubiquinone biosynthesis protein UbiJ
MGLCAGTYSSADTSTNSSTDSGTDTITDSSTLAIVTRLLSQTANSIHKLWRAFHRLDARLVGTG